MRFRPSIDHGQLATPVSDPLVRLSYVSSQVPRLPSHASMHMVRRSFDIDPALMADHIGDLRASGGSKPLTDPLKCHIEGWDREDTNKRCGEHSAEHGRADVAARQL